MILLNACRVRWYSSVKQPWPIRTQACAPSISPVRCSPLRRGCAEKRSFAHNLGQSCIHLFQNENVREDRRDRNPSQFPVHRNIRTVVHTHQRLANSPPYRAIRMRRIPMKFGSLALIDRLPHPIQRNLGRRMSQLPSPAARRLRRNQPGSAQSGQQPPQHNRIRADTHRHKLRREPPLRRRSQQAKNMHRK